MCFAYSQIILKYANKLKIFFLSVLVLMALRSIHYNISVNYVPKDNVSCHTVTYENDSLPIIDSLFSPPVKSIHFHETSCHNGLNSRQACTVESAARIHPRWQINVYFVGPVTKEKLNVGSIKTIMEYDNIKLFRLNILDHALGTPLERFVRSGALYRAKWKISHISDMLRLISLYKWSGVYLDLDMLVARSFEELKSNWAARESSYMVAAAALAFSNDELGRIIAEMALRDFINNYRGDLWAHNGPGVITRVLQKVCGTEIVANMSASTCKGFEVYGPELFYPCNSTPYFSTKEIDVGNPYTYHIWNAATKKFRVEKESVYARLAQKYCPKVYRTYGDDFGV